MNNISLILLLSLSLLQIGCMTTFRYVPVTDDSTNITYYDGFQTLNSVKDNEVSLSKNNFFNSRYGRIAFNIKVSNNSPKPFNFTYSDISVSHISVGESTRLGLFTYDYLIREEESSYSGAKAWNSLTALAELEAAKNAGYTTTNSAGSGGVYGSHYGNVYGNQGKYLNYSGYSNTVNYGSSSSQTYDAGVAHAARQAAYAENRKREEEALANHKRKINYLKSNIMRNNTIGAYSSHEGVIQLKAPRKIINGDYILFSVKVGNEYHALRFNLVEN